MATIWRKQTVLIHQISHSSVLAVVRLRNSIHHIQYIIYDFRKTSENRRLNRDLFVNLFQKLQFFFKSLSPVLGIDVQQCFIVQILYNT
jgi:hypothetical protein